MTIELPPHDDHHVPEEEPGAAPHPAAGFDPVTVYELLLATNRSVNSLAQSLEGFIKDLYEKGGPLGPMLAQVLRSMYYEAVAPSAIETSERLARGELPGGREVLEQAIEDLGIDNPFAA